MRDDIPNGVGLMPKLRGRNSKFSDGGTLNYFQLNFLIYILLVYVIISKLRVDASRSRIGSETVDFKGVIVSFRPSLTVGDTLNYSKNPYNRESYHLRLARSTLTLIPLMGTEYIIFAFVINEHSMQHIRYKIDLFFISFQGFFVSG